MKVNMSSEIMYKLEQIIRLNFPQIDFSFKNAIIKTVKRDKQLKEREEKSNGKLYSRTGIRVYGIRTVEQDLQSHSIYPI